VVVQTHGIEWKRAKWGWGMRNILRLCEIPSTMFPDAFVVTSISQQKYFKEKYKVDSVYIPPGVNNPIYREPDLIKKIGLKGKDYILFAARLVPEKGAHYLIQAYNRLKTDLKLVIAGDAKYEDKYKNQLYNLAKGNNNIIFTGFVQGQLKEELFSNAYLFVSPSEIEGLSVSLLEAMSYGNCCLVSDIPENSEAINEFGFSFRNKDIDDLCAKLDSLINGNNGTHFRKDLVMDYTLKNFSWDIITDKWEQLYLSLLK
jgi:glycosyltransferase involved in cell wall biosynthesis